MPRKKLMLVLVGINIALRLYFSLFFAMMVTLVAVIVLRSYFAPSDLVLITLPPILLVALFVFSAIIEISKAKRYL